MERTNKEVLQKNGIEKMILVDDILKRKRKYVAHEIREEGLFTLAVEEKIEGKPLRGRRRLEMITSGMGADDYRGRDSN